MNEYTASNGVRIEDRGGSLYANGSLIIGAGSTFRAAIAEFFRAEDDDRRGRWRWPENSDYVVRRSDFDPTYVHVLEEESFEIWGVNGFSDGGGEIPSAARQAARAFFDAHPEPKPWHEAKPGEVWEVKADAGTFNAWRLESGAFMFDDESFLFADQITSGRRIWPES